MSKKNGLPGNDMDETLPVKKTPGKKKDKNWKNHLLDPDEDDVIDLSSFGEFKEFDETNYDDVEDELS